MSIIRFDKVDVIFAKDPREALGLLDQGLSRDQILKKTGQIVGVESASLDIDKGEICVLMGLSGSGKSSLLRCINGLNTVSRGQLHVEHEGKQIDIASCTPAELKMMRTKRIAMVFQKFALMPWLTVRENISFGLEMQGRPEKERRTLVDEKLELVGLTQWRNKKPDELSGGMQQRVGLARALAMDADILLMDEPFSALDPLIRQGLQDELLELQRKLSKTIVFVSHDLDEALKLGSRIAIMKDGKIIQYSKPEEIVLNPADDYVRTFVAHTNPLNVLCGRSLMRTLDNCKRINGSVCIDPGTTRGLIWQKATPSRVCARAPAAWTCSTGAMGRPSKDWDAARPWWIPESACATRCKSVIRPATNWCCTTIRKWWGYSAIPSCTTRCWAKTWADLRP